MASTTMTVAATARPVLARQTARRAQTGFSGLRPAGLVRASPKTTFAAPTLRTVRRAPVAAQASAVEIAQIAGEAGEIAGYAGVMFVMTLVGLATGFIFLRVESLVEEGKI
eukprot:jgi/Tetstr1/436152/TSEL_024998.t1